MAEALTEEEEFRKGHAAPAVPWTGRQWFVMGVLLAVAIVSGLDRHIMSILQQPMKAELGLTDAQLGLISGPAFSIFYAFSAIPIARMAERFSRPWLLAASLSFWSGATAFCGAAMNLLTIGLCRVGVGLGEGGAHPICQSLVADNFSPRQRGKAMATYALGPPIASVIAPLLGGFVAAIWGWRIAFWVIGLPGILLAVILVLALKEPRTQAGAAPRAPGTFFADMKWLMKTPAFVCIFIGGAFNGTAIIGTQAFVPSFLMRTHDLSIAKAGGLLGMLGLVGVFGTMLGGYLADRFADSRGRSYVYVMIFSAVGTLSFYLVAFTAPVWPLVLIGLLGANITVDMKNGPNFAALQNIAPSRMRATAPAVFTIASNVIGAGLGPLVVGGLSDLSSAQMFAGAMGDFATSCPGGHAIAGAAPALAAACKSASAEGLRIALTLVTSAFVGSSFFFWLATRTISISKD